ncbi:protein of unknown function [Acidithiobacillus ferrivorans]|nr:hypothetical protein AFERRI_30452 [Acidithiobacillus ferrivorans]SMH66381.1 protein of unknown function [Acidithiobacillus ferrivorans]
MLYNGLAVHCMAGMMISTNMIFTEHSRLEYNKIFSINETKFGRGHALPDGETVVGGQGSSKHAAATTGALLRRQEKRARQAQTWTNLSRDDSQDRARLDKVFHKENKRQLRELVRDHVSVGYVIYCSK